MLLGPYLVTKKVRSIKTISKLLIAGQKQKVDVQITTAESSSHFSCRNFLLVEDNFDSAIRRYALILKVLLPNPALVSGRGA